MQLQELPAEDQDRHVGSVVRVALAALVPEDDKCVVEKRTRPDAVGRGFHVFQELGGDVAVHLVDDELRVPEAGAAVVGNAVMALGVDDGAAFGVLVRTEEPGHFENVRKPNAGIAVTERERRDAREVALKHRLDDLHVLERRRVVLGVELADAAHGAWKRTKRGRNA